MWFLLGAAALLGLTFFGAVAGLYDESTQPHTYTYTVTGEGTADIIYDLAPGNERTLRGVSLPWTTKVTGSSLYEEWTLQAHSSTGALITCTVALDGTPYSNSGFGSCFQEATSASVTTTSTAPRK